MIFKQLELLCEKRGTTPTAFVRDELKLSSSKVTAWKKGSIPKIETLQQIADYFDVSVGYLFDGDKKKPADLSEDRQRLLEMYDLLSEMEKGEILGELKQMTRGRSAQEDAG